MERQVLKDRVAIITGATRGLGEGIAKAMAREGAVAVLFGRDTELLQKHEKDIKAQGQRAIASRVDVADARQVNQAVAEVLKQFGKVDILVNNAGIAPSMLFLDIPDEVRDNVMGVNFNGIWNCTKAVLPGMIEQHDEKLDRASAEAVVRIRLGHHSVQKVKLLERPFPWSYERFESFLASHFGSIPDSSLRRNT